MPSNGCVVAPPWQNGRKQFVSGSKECCCEPHCTTATHLPGVKKWKSPLTLIVAHNWIHCDLLVHNISSNISLFCGGPNWGLCCLIFLCGRARSKGTGFCRRVLTVNSWYTISNNWVKVTCSQKIKQGRQAGSVIVTGTKWQPLSRRETYYWVHEKVALWRYDRRASIPNVHWKRWPRIFLPLLPISWPKNQSTEWVLEIQIVRKVI